jgi:Cytoskeletal-regulatory complex EF hand
LKVQLTGKEKGYYSNLLMQADPSGNNKVGGKEGVAFFKRSGLATDVLKNIWLLAAKTSPEYLLRDEFYLALRLIAYAQNNIQPTEDSIRFNLEVALPKFDPVPLALPPSEPGLPPAKVLKQPTAEEIAAALPDLDNLNIDALNNLHSLIPSVNQRE